MLLLSAIAACTVQPPPATPVVMPGEEPVDDAGDGAVVDDLDEGAPDDEGDSLDLLAAPPPPTPARLQAYAAERPKSVLDLQLWREEERAPAPALGLTATLVDLSPAIHDWLLLTLQHPGQEPSTWHLEVSEPWRTHVYLDPAWPQGLSLVVDGVARRCPLWSDAPTVLEQARDSGRVFAPLCEGLLSLRNPAKGRRSAMEWTTDFLRDKVWGGEKITTWVRDTLYADAQLATSEVVEGSGAHRPRLDRHPEPARVAEEWAGKQLAPVDLALPVQGAPATLEVGRWYPVAGFPEATVSVLQPRMVDPAVTKGWQETGAVLPLDEVEASALVYMIAFDLDQVELGFDQGTDHTRVGWSERLRPEQRDDSLPGPDGFDTLDPLVRTGRVNPANLPRLVATFTGGFKRSHGAFRSGPFSTSHHGNHYGWVEHGVVESKLWPGLPTVIVWADGSVEVRTWTEADDGQLWRVRSARQNGVPVVEPGPDGRPQPGALVTRWGDGNWSGSVEGKLRSVRGSLCVQAGDGGRYLLYGYFSSATPSAMVRVLAAYGCGTGMLTDMNALEHTYLSLHELRSSGYTVHHMIAGMEVLDKEVDGTVLSRFVGLSDNRDFFTVLRRVER